MRIYLAASFARAAEMESYRHVLEELGHEVTSRWHRPDANHDLGEQATDTDRARLAQEDLDDLKRARGIIEFTSATQVSRGGHHVEWGVALACLWMRLYLVGPRQNVFHYLPSVEYFDTFLECVRAIRNLPPPAPK